MIIGANSAKRHALSRFFTLIELLAAMAVFVLILTMVFAMLASAQRAWSAVDRNTRIYENARILMDVITRDLQAAVASDQSGGQIPFYIGTNSPSGTGSDLTRFMVTFVSATPMASGGDSRLAEISYTYDNYLFRRKQVEDNSTAGWDFYGETTTSWVNTTGSPGFQEVVDGIDDVEFAFFNDGGAMAASTVYTQVPSVIRVSFTLFDPDAISVSDSTRRQQLIDQSKRSFSKIIFLRSE